MKLTRRRGLVAGLSLAAFVAVAATFAWGQIQRYALEPVAITVEAMPITSFDTRDPAQLRFGALMFRGGLALTSKHPAFGGISGLHMEPDGAHFIAVTDRGSWLRGRIVYDNGKPAGIADAELAPILGADGTPLAAQKWFDVESITERDGMLYVGIERVEQIVRFNYRRDGLKARGEVMKVPADFKTFTNNKSLECLAASPHGAPHAGELIAVTEESLDAAGNLRAFVLKGAETERFSVKRSDEFDVSDCAVLPPGDLLLLERRYSIARGVAMRMRRVPLSAIKEGAVIDGPPLIQADLAYQIDNMEGVGIHQTPQGETVLTLVSDDNFAPIQRNLLLQFTLAE
ncbi:esterase-like activity of phytase family protein [Microbacteriaceae bacterium K1510]|nr:esterase-like activity of phytase family protein [Microbacteriaceae bacterium K1510]